MGGRLGSRFEEADDSTGLLLWQVTNRWQAAQRAALKPHGLTHVQFVLLASLAWLSGDEPVSQRALADHAATDAMMTSQVVRVLESCGWVTRERHPEDRRAFSLRVTDAGAALARSANSSVEQCDAEFFAALGNRSATFRGSLRRLRDARR
jgi:DNA-binding MarR family transcriptional regulator